MKIWVSKNSEVPVRDQLVAQITLGIASSDLAAGERLPSTRELARRFHIHQNTVSSAYRQLSENGLVEFKKGSGVFVSNGSELPPIDIAKLFDEFLNKGVAAGYSKKDIYDHIRLVLETGPPSQFLVVESDIAFREILIEEIRDATGITPEGVAFEKFSKLSVKKGTQIVAMSDEAAKLRPVLPKGYSCIFLNANSVPNSLSGKERPSENDLIAIVSAWERFISFAKLFLLAAKIDSEMFIVRLTRDQDWRKGIDQASLIICDFVTASQFPDDPRIRVFPLISEGSMEQLRRSTVPVVLDI